MYSISCTERYSVQTPFKLYTSRAIVFGPARYAGLDLPALYSNESIGQLRLLLGHLRLRDKTAKIILIDISYLQLLIGSATLFFNLPYKAYNFHGEDGWLVSIWRVLSIIRFKLAIQQAYVPKPPRENNITLMDYIVTLKLSLKQLKR